MSILPSFKLSGFVSPFFLSSAKESVVVVNNSLRPPRIAAIPGAVLDVVVKDEMKLDTAGRLQEGATTTREETPPQSKSTVTFATATSTIKRNPPTETNWRP